MTRAATLRPKKEPNGIPSRLLYDINEADAEMHTGKQHHEGKGMRPAHDQSQNHKPLVDPVGGTTLTPNDAPTERNTARTWPSKMSSLRRVRPASAAARIRRPSR